MGLLQNPVPEPPDITEKHSAIREADALRAQKEQADRLLGLIEALDAFSILPIVGADGKRYMVLAQNGGAQPVDSTIFHPFQIVDVSTATEKKIRIVYGTINGVPPDEMSPGDVPTYEFSISGTGRAWVVVTRNIAATTFTITSRTIGVGSTLPTSDDTTGYYELGSWNVTGDIVTTTSPVVTSLGCTFCSGAWNFWQ